MQYCSLPHQTLHSPPDTSTTVCPFCFGSASSFFLELFLCSSPGACWILTDLGNSSCYIFIQFMGFSRQECWSGLPFPSPVNDILSELSTMICLSWLVLHSIAHSFTELEKAVIHVVSLVSFFVIVVFILSALWRMRIRGLLKLPDGRDWPLGKLGLALVSKAILSKPLIQYSAYGF